MRRPASGAGLTHRSTFRTRLAGTDPTALRDAGPAGEKLRRAVFAGSRIGVIEPGYATKRFLYERAHAYGAELVLVGDAAGWARTLVEEGVAARLIDADASGDPDDGARAVLDVLGDEAERLDGVLTFWEDALPATARVAAALGLPGGPPAAADAARSKLQTLEKSRDAGLPTPRFVELVGAESLISAVAEVRFPAVIKPVFGSEAIGCLRVDDLPSLESGHARVSALIGPELNAIFRQGSNLLLEEYLDGIEFDVDFVLSGGECVFSAVSENWPTEEPYFVETGLHTPSSHPPERLAKVVELCVQTALALGFRDGVLHAEAKDTIRGPRILEVNGRLGGGRIADMHRLVTGVDLLEQQLRIAVGLPVVPSPSPDAACGVANVVIHPAHSGTIGGIGFFDHLAGDPTVIQRDVVVRPGQDVTAAVDGFPTVIGELTVAGRDAPAARASALRLVEALDIPYASRRTSAAR
jgi:biotin carboxylase